MPSAGKGVGAPQPTGTPNPAPLWPERSSRGLPWITKPTPRPTLLLLLHQTRRGIRGGVPSAPAGPAASMCSGATHPRYLGRRPPPPPGAAPGGRETRSASSFPFAPEACSSSTPARGRHRLPQPLRAPPSPAPAHGCYLEPTVPSFRGQPSPAQPSPARSVREVGLCRSAQQLRSTTRQAGGRGRRRCCCRSFGAGAKEAQRHRHKVGTGCAGGGDGAGGSRNAHLNYLASQWQRRLGFGRDDVTPAERQELG